MSLTEELVRRIGQQGPLTVADYMRLCLTHPVHGYYMTGDPFGAPSERGGDFVTAPEISQMFGELLGLWCADAWQRLGSPSPCLLVELGPGRGSLMADALRATAGVPGFFAAMDLHLLEASPALREAQGRAIGAQEVTWIESLAELPQAPLLLIANEFFDALPVRQFERREKGWAERLVALGEDSRSLAFGLAPPSPLNAALVPAPLRDAETGSLVEICPAGLSLAAFLGDHLARHAGAALIVDYGPAQSRPGPTLQALRRHQRQDVLQEPGRADLTAHVDFQSLAEAAMAKGARAFGPLDQGAFLQALGIETRAARLAAAAPEQAATVETALKRLVEPQQMGSLFKALALVSPESLAPRLTPPAGFGAD